MPLLDHFHPPLPGPRGWEGFLQSWTTFIARQLGQNALPLGYYAEIDFGADSRIDSDEKANETAGEGQVDAHKSSAAPWSPGRPKFTTSVNFAHLGGYEVRVYEDLGGAELRGAVELVSPANKERAASRRTFAARCAGHLKRGVGVVIVDVVTVRSASLHAEIFALLGVKTGAARWKSPTGLCAVAYRPVSIRNRPRVEVWPRPLALGADLPTLPLWLTVDLAVPLDLEVSYLSTFRSLRIPA